MHSYIHSNLGATWRLVVNFTPRPTLPARKNQLNKRLHGPHSRAGRFSVDRNHLFLTGYEPRAIQPAAYSLYRLRQNLAQNYTSSGPDLNQLCHSHYTTLLKKTPINEYCAVQYIKPKTTPLHQMGLRRYAPRLQLDFAMNRKILDSPWNKTSAGQPANSQQFVVCFLLGDSPASEIHMPTFLNTVPSSQTGRHLPAYEDGTECFETQAYKLQTPGNHPKESIQHSIHGESLKSRLSQQFTEIARLILQYYSTIIQSVFICSNYRKTRSCNMLSFNK